MPRSEHAPAPPLPARLEAVLADADRPMTKRELAAGLGADVDQVTGAVQELRRAGLVTTHGRGPATRYALAASSAAAPGRARTAGDDLHGQVVDALAPSRTALSMRSLAERLGHAPDELRPVILSLRHNGVVEMVGRRRSARYRVKSGA